MVARRAAGSADRWAFLSRHGLFWPGILRQWLPGFQESGAFPGCLATARQHPLWDQRSTGKPAYSLLAFRFHFFALVGALTTLLYGPTAVNGKQGELQDVCLAAQPAWGPVPGARLGFSS
jgi:hypothetical protein